ncbi:hypothetical protein QFC24_004869 [Naganishia onofrii]|uniref:Uncharacterized protein n=1 Tax=Naganishia onofrii TaxID=1851511 RepID=A0ACC2XAZ4_9TREE|nr:hypothetical protein QFC24_004869 [Naganishia onofrii]
MLHEPMNTLYNHPLRQPSTPTTTTNDGKSVTLLPEPTPSGPTAEDIAKVIKEHEEKEAAARKRKAGATADTKDGKKTGAENAVKEQEKDGSLSLKASSTPSKTTTMATGGQHRRYALHRGIFMMRQRELRAREQGVQAKEKSKGASVMRVCGLRLFFRVSRVCVVVFFLFSLACCGTVCSTRG